MENTNSNYSEVFEDGELKQYVVLKPVKRKRSSPSVSGLPEEELTVDLDLKPSADAPEDQSPVHPTTAKAKGDKSPNKMIVHLKTNADITKLYQKIPEQDGEASTASEPADVFDFYDEEDERRKREAKAKKQKIKDLKARTCMKCGKVFRDPIQVLAHKREAHRVDKIYKPSQELNKYMTGEPQKNCPICKVEIRRYQHKSAYISHLETHSLNRYTCKTCNMKFTRFDNLRVHEKRHIV